LRADWRLFCPHCDHNAILLARRVERLAARIDYPEIDLSAFTAGARSRKFRLLEITVDFAVRHAANDDCIARPAP
jgi:hypothetical protein